MQDYNTEYRKELIKHNFESKSSILDYDHPLWFDTLLAIIGLISFSALISVVF